MPRLTNLGALRCIDSASWEAQIKAAMKASSGRIDEAATTLDVSERTLYRWLDEDMFKDVVRAPTGVVRRAQDLPRKKGRAA